MVAQADRDTAVLGIDADISFAVWDRWLREQKSPVVALSQAAYELCLFYRVSPAFVLAMFEHESNSGLKGAATVTRSWGNTRQAYDSAGKPLYFGGALPVLVNGAIKFHDNGGGSLFPVFADWLTGLRATVARLTAQNWAYLGKGLRTVAQIIPVWAPSKDGNNVERYIAAVVGTMQTLRGRQNTRGTKMVRVVLRSGHHDTSGGNEFEHETTGLLVPRVAAAIRARGMVCEVITPDGPDVDTLPGDGNDSVPLDTAAAKAVAIHNSGKTVDAYVEIHTEGVANPSVRGCFGIFPDWGTDVDTDAKNKLIPMVIRRMAQVVGATRGNGVMSEKNTGVGADGFRLGVFRATAPLAATTTRVLFECGTHSNPIERAMMRTERYLNGVAVAIAEGLAEFFGVAAPLPEVPVQNPGNVTTEESIHFPETGCTLSGWFLEHWNAVQIDGQPAGMKVYGFPRTNEIREDGHTVQYFDRAVLMLVDGGTHWRNGVIGRLIGYEEAIRRGYILG